MDEIKLSDFYKIAEKMNIINNGSEIPSTSQLAHRLYMESKSKPQAKVYVLIGLPGAGKSTSINDIIEGPEKNNECVVVSRDIIRANLGYCTYGDKVVCSPSQEAEVSREFDKEVLNAAKEGKIVIIDNINLKKKYRDSYKILLKDYFVEWIYVYVEASALSKNIARRKGQINEDVFVNMISNFDFPNYSEYDAFKTVIS